MTEPDTAPATPPRAWLTGPALGLALLAGLMVLFAGPGTRSGLWHFRVGFSLMRYGAYLGLFAAALGVAAFLQRRRPLALLALGLGLATFIVPWSMLRSARRYPGIHDITTDVQAPPAFVSLLAERERTGATNSAAYEGDSIAKIQQEAYPDVRPVMIAANPDSAFTLAFNTARGMGWEIAEADPADGRIEATATTRWFGFKDDVVIRIRRASGISRLDIRSVSRVGGGDVGANAARIREFIRRLPSKATV
jgi:uncharacterized protein (DUF1499 family)